MYLRITGGTLQRQKVKTPGNRRTHPMGERIRVAIFNKIGDWLPGATILDAFAGTGALGFEAVSRGAASVIMIEKDRTAQKIITENIESLGVGDKVTLVRARLQGWLNSRTTDDKFDIIFVDPPYFDPQLKVVEKLTSLLKEGGILILSYSKGLETPILPNVTLFDHREYADAAIAYYRPN
ncbi:16S rRNA (guanine(966)-N(2))-methyltransferase RsmD [Candidatus Saccharibacteria bacterium]|nr:16S rRNA (guanine(966)-N(2))-methyltransferase RsmD [Candidatus Saccharibacteria bacterium]